MVHGTRGGRAGALVGAGCAILWALLPVLLHGADNVDATHRSPTAADILERALERAVDRDENGAELRYRSVMNYTSETLGPEGDVLETKTRRMLRYPLEGEMYEELIERDGTPLTPEEVRGEARRKANFVRQARRDAERGIERKPSVRRVRFNRQLMNRYQVQVAGTETVRDNVCWVLAYQPREGRLPSKGAMDKALNRSAGHLWIRKEDFELVRIEFEMREPVRYMWGLFATLRQAVGEIDFGEVGPGAWLPVRFQIQLDLRILAGVKAIRARVRTQWQDYEPHLPRTVPGAGEIVSDTP